MNIFQIFYFVYLFLLISILIHIKKDVGFSKNVITISLFAVQLISPAVWQIFFFFK